MNTKITLAVLVSVFVCFVSSAHLPYNRQSRLAPQYQSQPVQYASPEASARTVSGNSENDNTGNFNYGFETTNGISAKATGTSDHVPSKEGDSNLSVQGSYAWYTPEGTPIVISYIADQYGFRALGDAIPKTAAGQPANGQL